jgi:hypothetical protein
MGLKLFCSGIAVAIGAGATVGGVVLMWLGK